MVNILNEFAKREKFFVKLNFQTLCKSLVLLRNKKLASPLEVLQLNFEMFRCADKELRKYLFTSTISYIKQICTKRRDFKLNSVWNLIDLNAR